MNQNKTRYMIFVFQNLYFISHKSRITNQNLKIQNYKPQHINKDKDYECPYTVTLKIFGNLQTR